MLEVLYYPHGNYGPVAEYLGGLAKERPKAFARLALDLEILGAEGIQYRIFFGVHKGAAWLVHGIEKKSAKTPKDDLELARKRLREVMIS